MAYFNPKDTVLTINDTVLDGWVSVSVPPVPNLGSAENGGSGAPLYSQTRMKQVDVTITVQMNTPAAKFLVALPDTMELNGSISNPVSGHSLEMQTGAFVNKSAWPTDMNADGTIGNMPFVIRFNRVLPDFSSVSPVSVPQD